MNRLLPRRAASVPVVLLAAQPSVPLIILVVACLLGIVADAEARPPIRNAFFDVYPDAQSSVLYDVPSNASHCGVCHLDFDGGGPRNPYGLDLQVAIGQYPTYAEAILSLEDIDSDADGFDNVVEITDTVNFDNTPTFPGLTATNVGNVLNVDPADIIDHLTPAGGSDITPPDVVLAAPNGGESFAAGTTQLVQWTATDASGISHVDIFLSDDGGLTFAPVAEDEQNDGMYDLFVPNLPGTNNIVRVMAFDNAGNPGSDDSDAAFTIVATPGGTVPTTLRDFHLAGTQPHEGAVLDDPGVTCVTCHGGYDQAVEPWFNWRGSMMAHAARDPLFFATLVIAEQDAPSVGDLCLRCHTPGGWQEGRSTDTSGGQLIAKDRQSVQCDFCHRGVDIHYQPGVSPPEDLPILDSLAALPLAYANGQFVTDPNPNKRGPFADPVPAHQFLVSPFHVTSNICGTCHDVSNPAFVAGGAPGEYSPDLFDVAHPDGDLRNMMPVERTFSEWSVSEYATTGVYAPEFAGNKPDGIVSTCQDCHLRDVEGRGCNDNQAPVRSDLPLHDMTGGNHFIPDILPDYFPGEVSTQELAAGKQRAVGMLELAASMSLVAGNAGAYPTVEVTITNETGHKLPSGYPEGRRMWLHVKAYDGNNQLVYESGAYDPATGVLSHDEDVKIYQIKPGISSRLGGLLGIEPGPSFHFVLNDSVYSDNRIPPRGFTNADFTAIQSPPVGHTYADGQYWDTTVYELPLTATFVEATLYYQSTSKEYIEFLRDANVTNDLGHVLHDAWVAQGRAAPVAMLSDTVSVAAGVGVAEAAAPRPVEALHQNRPNPFNPETRIAYSLAAAGPIELRIYDLAGRVVRTLVDSPEEAGAHSAVWDGRNDAGERVASGIYLVRVRAAASGFESTRKAVLLQ